jgi:hypothetical protein
VLTEPGREAVRLLTAEGPLPGHLREALTGIRRID